MGLAPAAIPATLAGMTPIRMLPLFAALLAASLLSRPAAAKKDKTAMSSAARPPATLPPTMTTVLTSPCLLAQPVHRSAPLYWVFYQRVRTQQPI